MLVREIKGQRTEAEFYAMKGIKSWLLGKKKYGTRSYFDRANFYARLVQLKYFIHDYIIKPKYKVIEYRQEFQQELLFVLPFAYWHYLNGTLDKTISSRFTKELYFFSEDHEEVYDSRISRPLKERYSIPNMYHCSKLYADKWAQVPLKSHYKNDIFLFEKPLLIIANKYNSEWGKTPINYFSIPVLDKIITQLKDKYQLVYNRPKSDYIVMDNSDILELNEEGHIRENHPEVIIAEDLFLKHRDVLNNYNHFQLLLYANCNRFVSVHGGTATLASYFGGKNIILSKRGHEHHYNEFENIFPALSGAKIYHAKSEKEVFRNLREHY